LGNPHGVDMAYEMNLVMVWLSKWLMMAVWIVAVLFDGFCSYLCFVKIDTGNWERVRTACAMGDRHVMPLQANTVF
jgi:hypothetical protein